VTLRCGIPDEQGKPCNRRAGFIFETPDGPVFTDASTNANAPHHVMFVYGSGLLTIRTAAVDGPTRMLSPSTPYACCGRHGPFLLATKSNPIGRDVLDIVGTGRRSVVVVPAEAGRSVRVANGGSGELGIDLAALSRRFKR
jgi:hypothetical protein